MRLASILGFLGAASCQRGPCVEGGTCASAARYDLMVTESDTGRAGISTGEGDGVAFALDTRRDHLTTSPHLDVTVGDMYNQFPGTRVFAIRPYTTGTFDVTATGGGMSRFTFRLVVGHLRSWTGGIQLGDIVVQQWGGGCGDAPPQALPAPSFELVQDEFKASHTLVPASLQFTFTRRAYRYLELSDAIYRRAPTSLACVPDDFPRYPLTQSTGGVSPTCTWDIPSNDSQANVLAFYKSQLNQGDWRIASTTGSTITFTRRTNFGFVGTVAVDSSGSVRVDIPHAANICNVYGTPRFYDLTLTESDSGQAGISTGAGVAFALDSRRSHLTTSPPLDVAVGDPYGQFPNKRLFVIAPNHWGVFDVTATGDGMAPFTFHLVVGRVLPFARYDVGNVTANVLHRGDVVVQQWGGGSCNDGVPGPLASPTFELLQDTFTTPSPGLEAGALPHMRRAYRAVQPGAQGVSISAQACSNTAHIYPYNVVVSDLPTSFLSPVADISGERHYEVVDGSDPNPDGISAYVADSFVIVLMGDGQQVSSWSVEPSGGVIRLPDSEVGPQPPGATLIPFKVMSSGTQGIHNLRLFIGSRYRLVPITVLSTS